MTSVGTDDSLFSLLESRGTARCMLWSDKASGLRAILAIDDLTLGPAAGGIRTRSYASLADAMDDAARLARAMTLKCSVSGIDAGGAKVVVLDHPGMNRPAAFERLGQLVQELGGRFITAGDLGTTADDLAHVARHCTYVFTDESVLANAVARGLVCCLEACVGFFTSLPTAETTGPGSQANPFSGVRIAIQGCGAIGAAAARRLAAAGATLVLADTDQSRAHDLASELGASVVSPDQVLTADVDIVCPCAVGGVITPAVVDAMRAWGVCGAANNIVASAEADHRMLERGIVHVPDIVASAGGAIAGVAAMVMNLGDCIPLVDALGQTAREILVESRRTGTTASQIAEERARARIQAVRQVLRP